MNWNKVAVLIVSLLLGAVGGGFGTWQWLRVSDEDAFARIYAQRFVASDLALTRVTHQALASGDLGKARENVEIGVNDGLLFGGLCLDRIANPGGEVPAQFRHLVATIETSVKYMKENNIPNTHFTTPYAGPEHPLVKPGMVTASYLDDLLAGKHKWRVIQTDTPMTTR